MHDLYYKITTKYETYLTRDFELMKSERSQGAQVENLYLTKGEFNFLSKDIKVK